MQWQNTDILKKFCGIYKIQNLINKKVYIGSTMKCFYNRWKQHLNSLKCNCHDNSYLQYAWNKYGSSNFEFSILEIIKKDYTRKYFLEREQYFINKFHSFKSNGYNLSVANSNTTYYNPRKTVLKNEYEQFCQNCLFCNDNPFRQFFDKLQFCNIACSIENWDNEKNICDFFINYPFLEIDNNEEFDYYNLQPDKTPDIDIETEEYLNGRIDMNEEKIYGFG